MHLLEQFREKPRSCAYLPQETAQLEIRVMLDVTEGELESLLEGGWRRFGPIYFRPSCARCTECVSLRVLAGSFAPSKSQRRAARAASSLRRVVGPPQVDDARLDLYARWHASREVARGWEANPQTRERYALEFAFPHPCAREAAFYDDGAGGRLVGVGLFDATPNALSAAFFYYDPAYAQHSLGTANVVSLVDDARAEARPYVYLGYRVRECRSLQYKASFRPHELRGPDGIWTLQEA
ncbi:MAG TPA: GNAT family N-acetyltransferase [Polyangiaceae bacterium]|jgi:arginyl-tRNA--protein-N-Asp/Glu arginylyltransferase|nr:GNAT family N-acetyltransferase [Polyangiaceae bacterium]